MESDNTAIQQPVVVKKRVAYHAGGLHKLYGNPSKKPMLNLATAAAAAEGGGGNVEEGNNEKISMVGRKEIRPPIPAPPASSSTTTASTVQKSKNISLPPPQKPVTERDMVFETASLKYAARKRLTLGWEPLLNNTYSFVYLQTQYQFPLDQKVYLGRDLGQQPSPPSATTAAATFGGGGVGISAQEGCKHFAFKGVGETKIDKETWQFRKLCQVRECFCICLRGTKCVKHRCIDEKNQ
jgi:hypothetical protein